MNKENISKDIEVDIVDDFYGIDTKEEKKEYLENIIFLCNNLLKEIE